MGGILGRNEMENTPGVLKTKLVLQPVPIE